MGAGYASDISGRAVQQWGDTGQIDLSTLDYRPGVGTGFGALAGATPALQKVFAKYLINKSKQASQGQQIVTSYEDFRDWLKQTYGMSEADITMHEQGTGTPYNPFNRPIWSPGEKNNPIWNAWEHIWKPDHPESFGLQPGDPRYVPKTHELLDNIPDGTMLKETKKGMKRYYNESVHPQGKGIMAVEEPNRAPRTLFTPTDQLDYYSKQDGKYRGRKGIDY